MGWPPKRSRATGSNSEHRRSGFEELIEKQLIQWGGEYTYETVTVYFTPPVKRRRKTWDWPITTRSGKKIIVETKGWWKPSVRLAELEAIRQNPEHDVRYVFENARTKIYKGSKTSYADVCKALGVPYAEGVIPPEWLDE